MDIHPTLLTYKPSKALQALAGPAIGLVDSFRHIHPKKPNSALCSTKHSAGAPPTSTCATNTPGPDIPAPFTGVAAPNCSVDNSAPMYLSCLDYILVPSSLHIIDADIHYTMSIDSDHFPASVTLWLDHTELLLPGATNCSMHKYSTQELAHTSHKHLFQMTLLHNYANQTEQEPALRHNPTNKLLAIKNAITTTCDALLAKRP
ncbi:uncharacterized protein ACA1_199580 [Acanthamoeba castellanii str. Neff]|uniref:Endonuclease/exonuclease/phosphatase domain-containing protein n=1 Tax=Acanthamoeba castellanii (strain ATCC 30010 / Neff) TaxID=1257118 RepID=L8H3A1_ACACF|nr:uncharacterized protein ACA1_199580 [Acanthamoeba castellanii str. Neff]ELR19675.1 hypothetical protein ACA1_199580 [Acanthamoeba castellanii str. Neff]